MDERKQDNHERPAARTDGRTAGAIRPERVRKRESYIQTMLKGGKKSNENLKMCVKEGESEMIEQEEGEEEEEPKRERKREREK